MCQQQLYKILGTYIFIFGFAMAQSQVKVMASLFETHFLDFLSVIRQNKWHFWNPETKQDKIGMSLKDDFQDLAF